MMLSKKYMMTYVTMIGLLFASTVLDAAKQSHLDDDEKEPILEWQIGGINPKYTELREHIAQDDRTWVKQFLKARMTKLVRNEAVLDDGEPFAAFVKIFNPIRFSKHSDLRYWPYRQSVLNYLLIEAVHHGDIWTTMALVYDDADPLAPCRAYKRKTAKAIAAERNRTQDDKPRHLEQFLGLATFDQQKTFNFCREIRVWIEKVESYPHLMNFIHTHMFITYLSVKKEAKMQAPDMDTFEWALAYLEKIAAAKKAEAQED